MTNEKKSLLKRTAADTLKLATIALIAILIISGFKISFALGFLIGTIISILNFYFLISSVDKLFYSSKGQTLSPILRFGVRFVIIGAAVVASLIFKNIINLYTLVFGFTMVQLAMVVKEISQFRKH